MVEMMSTHESLATVCPRFVQNAWRQDLCSNCFRLRQDHAHSTTGGQVFGAPHVTTVYQSANSSWHELLSGPSIAAPAVPGILRSGGRRASTGSVGFLETAPQVIGYGGVDEEEEGEEEEEVVSSDEDIGACDSLENYDLSAEDKAFAELTEKNTKFNEVIENLVLAERHVADKERINESVNSTEVSLEPEEAKTILAEEHTRPLTSSEFSLPRPWVRIMNSGRCSREGDAADETDKTTTDRQEDRAHGTTSPDPTLVPPPDYTSPPPPPPQPQQPMHYSSSAILKGLPMAYCSTSVLKGLPPPPTCPSPASLPTPTSSPTASPTCKPPPPKTKPKLPAKPTKLTCLSASSSLTSSPETTPKIEGEKEEIKNKISAETNDDGDAEYGVVYRTEAAEVLRKSNEYSEINDTNAVIETSDNERQPMEEEDVDMELSFQDKVLSIACHLDLTKRNPKRQAPPPPHAPLTPCSSIASSEPEAPPPTPTSPPHSRKVLPNSPPLSRKSGGFFSPDQFHRESKKLRTKFSLKKLLKFGKDGDDGCAVKSKFGSGTPVNSVNERRPRPQILHPIDLANMAANQLAANASDCEATVLQNGSCETSSLESATDLDKQAVSPAASPVSNDSRNKPCPPPRKATCPARPPPPTIQHSDHNNSQTPSISLQDEQDAENLDGGEVRTVLVPKKPERGSPTSNPKESVHNGCDFDCEGNDIPETPFQDQENQDEDERTYYEPPDILDDIPPPVPLHNVQEVVIDDNLQDTSCPSQVSVMSGEKVSRQERHTRAAGVVFLENNGGFGGSEESDTVSVSSSEVASSPASNGPRDLSHLYAEVVRKAKRERHAICLQVSPEEDSSQVVRNGYRSNGNVKRASLRNGHNAIHRSLEENYNAVVAANHETLGQLLEQVLSMRATNIGCSRLKDCVLHWSDFAIDKTPSTKFGNTILYNGTWGQNVEVTLMVMPDPPLPPSSTKGPFILTPLATFHEFLPTYVLNPSLPLEHEGEPGLQRGTVWVFGRTEVTSLRDISRELALLRTDDIDEFEQSFCLLMLQLISALKHLQAQGVEEVDGSMDWLAVVRNQDSTHNQAGDYVFAAPLQLVLIGGGATSFDQGNMTSVLSLCECGLEMMAILLCGDGDRNELDLSERLSCKRAFLGVAETLQKEKSTSLSRAKTILELMLWGPTPEQSLEDEKALQRWLDLERATVLSELVTSRPLNRIDLSMAEEYRLLFLVRTSWRAIREAATVVVSTTSTA